MKLLHWKAEDTVKIFGSIEAPILSTILPIAHTQDASEYIGVIFDDIINDICTEITDIPVNYYFFYRPSLGNWLTKDLVLFVLKDLRQKELNALTVTIDNNIFDADEDSQNRMSRAITAMSDTDTIMWKLHDNTFGSITKEALKGVLLQAGIKQTELWLKYS
jgi:hypothetical protein